MLDHYRLQLEQIEQAWHTRNRAWQEPTCRKVFWTVSAVLFVGMMIGVIASVTIIPEHYKGLGFFCALFIPIYLWCLLVAITVAGSLGGDQASSWCASCSNSIWTCLLQFAFWIRCNRHILTEDDPAEDLTRLLLRLRDEVPDSKEETNDSDVFHTPHRIARAKMQLTDVTIYNEQLSRQLPLLLCETDTFGGILFPLEVLTMMIEFVLL
jgi:hypothetical protein